MENYKIYNLKNVGEKVELPWEVKLLRAMDFPTMKLHKRHTY